MTSAPRAARSTGESADEHDGRHVEQRLRERRNDRRGEQLADRLLGDDAEDDERARRGRQRAQRPARCDGAGRERRRIAALAHLGQADQSHGGRGRQARAAHRAEARAARRWSPAQGRRAGGRPRLRPRRRNPGWHPRRSTGAPSAGTAAARQVHSASTDSKSTTPLLMSAGFDAQQHAHARRARPAPWRRLWARRRESSTSSATDTNEADHW